MFSSLDRQNTAFSYICVCTRVINIIHYGNLTSAFATPAVVFYRIRKKTKTSSVCLKGYFSIIKPTDGLYIYGYDSCFFFFVYHNVLFGGNRRCLTFFSSSRCLHLRLSSSFFPLFFAVFSLVPNKHTPGSFFFFFFVFASC